MLVKTCVLSTAQPVNLGTDLRENERSNLLRGQKIRRNKKALVANSVAVFTSPLISPIFSPVAATVYDLLRRVSGSKNKPVHVLLAPS